MKSINLGGCKVVACELGKITLFYRQYEGSGLSSEVFLIDETSEIEDSIKMLYDDEWRRISFGNRNVFIYTHYHDYSESGVPFQKPFTEPPTNEEFIDALKELL